MTFKLDFECKKKKRPPFSKVIVVFIIVLVTAFLVFCCYEMHIQMDLSPIAYIGTGVIGLLAAVVGFYMWRAKQSDMYQLEMKKIEEKAQLRKKYGEYYQDESVPDIEEEVYEE